MNNFLITLIMVFSVSISLSQTRYITRNGHIGFFSEAPLENIEAHNYQVNSIFDKESGRFAFSVLIRGFEFEKALMQEHFNENFLESDKFPKASFSGQIADYDQVTWEEGKETKVTVSGELTIHGVTRNITAEGIMKMENEGISGKSTFPLRPEDYDIKIPKVVRNNIAEIVDVTVELTLNPAENQ